MAYYFRIDHKLRLLAAFSAKCASNSIHNWLDGLASASGQGNDFKREDACRLNARQLTDYSDYTTVLFLRDPLRRLASFYSQWVVRRPEHWCFADDDQRFPLQHKSFRSFLYIMEHLFSNDLAFQHHLELQTQNISSFEFQHVILTEDLLTGIQSLNKKLGYDVEIGNQNHTKKEIKLEKFVGDCLPSRLAQIGIPEYKWFYDAEMLQMAERIYALDMAYYRTHDGKSLSIEKQCHENF